LSFSSAFSVEKVRGVTRHFSSRMVSKMAAIENGYFTPPMQLLEPVRLTGNETPSHMLYIPPGIG
jgi:hypothetical protein